MAHQKISDLPNSWIVTKLPDAIDLILGQSPASSDCNSDGHGLPFFQGKTEFGKVYPKVRKYCTAPKKLAEKNDVLLSVRAPVGPTNLATEKCAIGRGLAALRTNSDIDFKYLLFYMRHIEPWLSEQGTGSTFKAVSGVFLKELDFFVSPLPEQKRIVEKLDSLLAQVDTIQQRLNNLPDIIKRFRQSVLAAAVSGKLTEQWRGENGQTLKKQESALIKFRDKALTELPSTWSWRRFDEVASIKSNLVDPLLSPDDVHIAPNHIQANEGKLLEFATVSKDGVKSNKHRFYPGQILYSKIRPYLCKVVIVDFEGVCSADMYPVETEMETKFMFNWMLSFQFTEWASNGDSRTVLPKINQKQLSEIPTPVPPAAEQTEIVRLVEQYFALADTLEKNLANAKQRVDNLTQSILAKAFRGELVPQDPNDEPADKLLARIKAARLEAEKLEKAAKKAAKASKK
tara:strand:+ start:239 stop:1612 length:1374 start_codon:yes stop_codon:yes gene_type:complete